MHIASTARYNSFMGPGTHRFQLRILFGITCSILFTPAIALAGMPSFTLTDLARARFETISFFMLVLLVSTALVKVLWNWLARDFPRLPRLTYPRALGLVALWGFLFTLVLTMISGARELLTPGAWERNGATYRLTGSGADNSQNERRDRLVALKTNLWNYANAHHGELPPDDRVSEIPAESWETTDPSRIRYIYRPGATANARRDIVAYEPIAAFGTQRWVLLSNGEIMLFSNSEIDARLERRDN